MWRLIALVIAIVIVLAGIDYVITSAGSHEAIITITGKYMEGNSYFVDTISLDKYKISRDLYYKIDGGITYKVKIFNGEITDVIYQVG